MSIAVFAYGSLVSRPSAAITLGREDVDLHPATLTGWRRSFTLIRDNRTCEKTFARRDDDSIPDHVLALNLDAGGSADTVNGALLRVTDDELVRIDRREVRYRRIDVSPAIAGGDAAASGPVFTYVARPEHHAPVPPAGAVVIAAYERTVEDAFTGLGPGQFDHYLETTERGTAERIEAYLVRDEIPAGNPRRW